MKYLKRRSSSVLKPHYPHCELWLRSPVATTTIINILSQTVPVATQSIQLLAVSCTGFRSGTLMFLHGNKQVAVFPQFAESIISEKLFRSVTFSPFLL